MRVNIEAERARNRMTKEDVAKYLNVSVKTYYNWLNEETDIPGTKLMAMSKLFNVSMEYLLTDVNPMDFADGPGEKGA